MVSSILKAIRRNNRGPSSEQSCASTHSEKEDVVLCNTLQFAAVDADSNDSDDDFWGEDDIAVREKRSMQKKKRQARQHEKRANNLDCLRSVEDLEKFCCEAIEGSYRTFWMLFEEIIIGAGNNHYNKQNLSKSIENNPSVSAPMLVSNSTTAVDMPRRMSNEAKAAYLLRKLKETKPLSFSDSPTLQQGSETIPHTKATSYLDGNIAPSVVTNDSDCTDTTTPLKEECITAKNSNKPNKVVKDAASAAKKAAMNPLRGGLDTIKSDLERQRAALKYYRPLENVDEDQDNNDDSQPVQNDSEEEDDNCSLEELGQLIEFRDTDLAFLEYQLERQGSLGSVVCSSETKRRLKNVNEETDHCLVEITPNVAMFVLPPKTLTI